jgi:hypothetical protein
MKRKTEDGMVQSAVWLPRDLHQRLKRAGGERGMGEEIRRRLEASFAADPAKPKTNELLASITFAADETNRYYGDWAEDAFAFEVLKACVDLLLAVERPKGEAVPNPSDVASLFFADDPSPKDISRIIVADLLRTREGKRR